MTIRPTFLTVIFALVVVYFAPLQRTPRVTCRQYGWSSVPVKVAPIKVVKPQPKPALPQLTAFTAEWCGPCQHANPRMPLSHIDVRAGQSDQNTSPHPLRVARSVGALRGPLGAQEPPDDFRVVSALDRASSAR